MFMENHPLQSLIDLIEFDRGIIKKEHALDEIKRRVASLTKEVVKLQEDHDTTEQQVKTAKKIVHEHESTMKELDEREKEKKSLLDGSNSQKMYETLKKEINFLKKSQYDHEKKLVQCWKELEAAQKSLDEQTLKFAKKRNEIISQQKIEESSAEELLAELKQLYNTRTEKEKTVPNEWVLKYNMMRAQTDDPIVRVEFGSCGGCFAQLPPQCLLDLKRNKLMQCSSCYRFIYLPEEIEEEPLKKQTE